MGDHFQVLRVSEGIRTYLLYGTAYCTMFLPAGLAKAVTGDWFCYVFITQDRNGNVNTVDVDNCGDSIMNIDENPKLNSFKNSIERAVYKASPFPLAPSEDAFSEQIIFEFRVDAVEIM